MEDDIKFEKALERLSRIVEDLEGGNAPLEEALKKYEEGVSLARVCSEKLKSAETKIEILTRALNGLDTSGAVDEDGEEAPKKERKRSSRKHAQDDPAGGELLI